MAEQSALIGMRVAVDPRVVPERPPKGMAGRRGTVDHIDGETGWPVVTLDPVGRERKHKTFTMPVHSFVPLTEKNERQLAAWEAT